MTVFVDTPGAMRALGGALSELVRPGDVLLLTGDMGEGKSEFCRGLARGLGITGPVTSPTFTILNVYEEGRLPFHHFDWYRVNGADEPCRPSSGKNARPSSCRGTALKS